MIPDRKSPLFTRWFSGDAQRRVLRTFGEVRVRGLPEMRRLLADHPVLVVSNHTSWWDSLVILYLTVRTLGADSFAMMDAKNLRALPFFGKVGAFGVDLTDVADGARAIRHAAKLLDRPGRLVWIFAQGREVPITVRPLGFRGGSGEIARVAKRAVVVPVALRYEYGARPLASLFVSFGAPLERERDVVKARDVQESAVTRELDRLEHAIATGSFDELPLLHAQRPSFVMTVLQRMLAWLTRP